LLESDAPIAEIAARSGFADQSHLSRVMKRHAGISPAEFRKTVRDSAGMRSSRSARSVAACSD
jgi:AraC-like DNA-binding protein